LKNGFPQKALPKIEEVPQPHFSIEAKGSKERE
jgi:hypothetical protein